MKKELVLNNTNNDLTTNNEKNTIPKDIKSNKQSIRANNGTDDFEAYNVIKDNSFRAEISKATLFFRIQTETWEIIAQILDQLLTINEILLKVSMN